MRCPRCQQENPQGAKFCLECGARLALTCSKCGTELPAGAKFCPECGQSVSVPSAVQPRLASPEAYTPKHLAEKILTSRSALEGERKQVTVLFVDIVESSRLAERLDPEVMHQLMDRALQLMADTVRGARRAGGSRVPGRSGGPGDPGNRERDLHHRSHAPPR